MSIASPRLRILRRLGTPLPGLTRKTADRRPEPPGAHGAKRGRRRPSAFRRRLEEKQKLRFNYGLSERQLRRCVETARAKPGPLAENLLAGLERRLDNVVFRLGLAPTIPAARQLVVHGHVTVDDRRVDRPGYLVCVGETIALGARARTIPVLRETAERGPVLRLPSCLARDPMDPCRGRVVAPSSRADVPFPLSDALVVEFYSR